MQRINSPAQPVRVSRMLKNLLALIIIVVLASSSGLSTLAFARSVTSAGPAALYLDLDGADRVSANPDTWNRGPGASARVCGRGPQTRLIEVAMTFFHGLNTGDFSAWRGVLADDFQAIYAPTGPAVLDAETAESVNRSFRIAFEDLHFDIDRVLVSTSCDFVVAHWTATGTHTGPLVTASGAVIPPTGLGGVISGVYTAEIRDGQIVAEWTHWDQLSLLVQLGLIDPL